MLIGNPTFGGGSVKRVTIYGLFEAGTDDVRYVGATSQSVEKRVRAHRHASKYQPHHDYNTEKSKWIRSIGEANVRYRVLEECDAAQSGERERYWIDRLGTAFPRGVNTATGGSGGPGQSGEENPGAKLTLEQVEEIIARFEEDGVTSRSLGRDYGVTKTLILKIDHGVLWPEVDRPLGTHRLARNTKRVLTIEEVRLIRDLTAQGLSRAEISRRLGVSYDAVANVDRGVTWKGVE